MVPEFICIVVDDTPLSSTSSTSSPSLYQTTSEDDHSQSNSLHSCSCNCQHTAAKDADDNVSPTLITRNSDRWGSDIGCTDSRTSCPPRMPRREVVSAPKMPRRVDSDANLSALDDEKEDAASNHLLPECAFPRALRGDKNALSWAKPTLRSFGLRTVTYPRLGSYLPSRHQCWSFSK